ncbi:MAG: hypothetical protein R8P61_37675 [Bacteroidia bacterium]|nr:hypothetical protein [Bacteroidia bacterium]
MSKIIYVDMDDVLCQFSARSQAIKSKYPEVPYPQSHYGFFSGLEPMPGALEAMKKLNALEGFDIYILTAPSVWNPLCYTEKRVWVEKHLGMKMVNKLIISPNKGLNKGDYLIDDHLEGRGQEGFEGKLLHFGSNVFPNWDSVLSYFQNKYVLAGA